MADPELTRREWLDTVRRGWGAKFSLAFEEVGLDLVEDVVAMREDG